MCVGFAFGGTAPWFYLGAVPPPFLSLKKNGFPAPLTAAPVCSIPHSDSTPQGYIQSPIPLSVHCAVCSPCLRQADA